MESFRPLVAFCFCLVLVACGDGGSENDTPPNDGPPANFPVFSTVTQAPLQIEYTERLDSILTTEQVTNASGVPETNSDISAVIWDGTRYTVFCETSYLPTTANTADEAYQQLITGQPETIFAFEEDVNSLSFRSINSVEVNGKSGQEILYNFPANDNEISGQGRVFYFNNANDNLTRSAVVYFECFGFTESFNREINTVQAYLNAPTFTGDGVIRKK